MAHRLRIEKVKSITAAKSPILLPLSLLISLMYLSIVTGIGYAGENVWTWTGASGWPIQISTSTVNPNIAYARTYEGVLRSTDGGATWSNITQAVSPSISRITVSDRSPNVLYASSISGTIRTDDYGETWQNVHDRGAVYAVSPADWREAYLVEVLTSGPTQVTSVLSKTIDGGQTWQSLGSWLPSYGRIEELAIAPSAPNILIAITERPSNGIMYKSMDGGMSWTTIGEDYISDIRKVVFDPKNSDNIYLATNSPGGWKTMDGGNTWLPLANGLQTGVWDFIINPDNTQIIHAANSSSGVQESLDGGQSWSPLNTGIQGLSVRSIAIASRNPLRMYAGIENAGIWSLTRTELENFSVTINDGALFTNQTAVTLTLSAPSNTTQMMISNDGGFGDANWETFNNTKVWTITDYEDAVIPRTVYVQFMTNGQPSAQYQDDIILDQTPPTGSVEITDAGDNSTALPTSVLLREGLETTQINEVYLPFTANKLRPGFFLVGLRLSAVDDVSGVESMRISNERDFADAEWNAFVRYLDWWIPENGSDTVYAQFRDRAGNESPVYSTSSVNP